MATINGTSGADSLTGTAGADALFGFEANDTLNGLAGADSMSGGSGDDRYYVDTQSDLIFENPNDGIDLVIASGNFYLYANVENLNLASGAGDIFGVGNELSNVMNGNEGNNLLLGGAGDDVIAGNAGNDQIFGEDGNDLINGGPGTDYIDGGTGNDTIAGGTGPDAIYGSAGNDSLIGGTNDFQTDILVGGDGNDTLDGSSGLGEYDLMDGGNGNDLYYVDTPADLTFEAVNGGTDTVIANINGAGYYLYANVENLTLAGTTPFGVGNELNNVLTGSSASNYLLGGAGNDTINGKVGSDVLFGEGGADTFVFDRTPTGSLPSGDVVGDFTPGVDKISINGTGITSYTQLVNSGSIFQNGGDTGINLGFGDFIILNGVNKAALTAGDFLFG